MGAPLKKIKRNEVLYVQVYPDEKRDIKRISDNSIYQNVSEFVRDVTINGKFKVISIDQDLVNRNDLLLQQVRNVGNNFNQLLKLLHSKKLDYFTKDDVKLITNNLSDIKDIYNNIELYYKNDS